MHKFQRFVKSCSKATHYCTRGLSKLVKRSKHEQCHLAARPWKLGWCNSKCKSNAHGRCMFPHEYVAAILLVFSTSLAAILSCFPNFGGMFRTIPRSASCSSTFNRRSAIAMLQASRSGKRPLDKLFSCHLHDLPSILKEMSPAHRDSCPPCPP